MAGIPYIYILTTHENVKKDLYQIKYGCGSQIDLLATLSWTETVIYFIYHPWAYDIVREINNSGWIHASRLELITLIEEYIKKWYEYGATLLSDAIIKQNTEESDP
jgi:hypothetical protein